MASTEHNSNDSHAGGMLTREVGVGGAVMMGLGSIIGTGVFVSIGIAAGIAGPAVVVAIAAAAVVAACNGLSSAQLAAAHPVSGGTYEYGYRRLTPALGFTAGWMFLCAKSASAATAALGLGGYLQAVFDFDGALMRIAIGLAALVALTAFVLAGLRRSNALNIAIVSVTIVSLLVFVAVCATSSEAQSPALGDILGVGAIGDGGWPFVRTLLEASALMFVAYTGYGRIATLGEEIHDPKKNIPVAIIVTLVVTVSLYIAVAWAAVSVLQPASLERIVATHGATLVEAAESAGGPTVRAIVTLGAITAMLGVLLNLILGLSRVALAMGRRGDLPGVFGRVNQSGTTPVAAVLLVAGIIAALVCIGDIKTTWSFSAFTVLVYYALTNASALRLKRDERLYPRVFMWMGLAGCAGLAFWVQPRVWMVGLGLIAVGLLWHWTASVMRKKRER